MARIDPYKHEERYFRWKNEQNGAIPGVPIGDADIIRRFLHDMELGLNVSRTAKRGPRGYHRLNTLRTRVPVFARKLRERFGNQFITDVTEEQLHTLISEISNGVVRKDNGEPYMAISDFVKDFRAFWHWHMESQRRNGTTVPDVTRYLDTRKQKPRWVYLTESEVKRLCEEAKYEYRVLMMFLFDSGLRSPSELINVRVADFSDDFTKLNIREEISKTFGRRINLMLCPALVRDYVQSRRLERHDRVFAISPPVVNRYLRRLASRVLGNETTLAGDRSDKLTMYDFRHISACYWAVRYKSEAALKYRFGWTKSERIRYYTEFLGMTDTITEDDVLLDSEKSALERRLSQAERDNQLLRERTDSIQHQLERIEAYTERLLAQVGVVAA